MKFIAVVEYLENLTMMPKTMPGLEKMRSAVADTNWFYNLDPKKIITVAGTNGKGTTCKVLEALLRAENKKVGLYTSPHLIKTTERIRYNGADISENDFVALFIKNKPLIDKHQLSHFEALTLMAADYFFSNGTDYVIFEVGLGGTFDATNIFPNGYSVITKLGLDHQNILGSTIQEIANNKFGIIKENSLVVHHKLPEGIVPPQVKGAKWVQAKVGSTTVSKIDNIPKWSIHTPWGDSEFNLIGDRAVENTMTALTLFEELGFSSKNRLGILKNISWSGRMQKIKWPKIMCPIYLSGDHNLQGILSLIDILKYFEWKTLHLIVGIGQDKSCEEMFSKLLDLPRVKLYLTETPFKGRKISEYPKAIIEKSGVQNENIFEIFDLIQTEKNDLVVVTGSLYLVGKVLQAVH